MLGLNQHGLDSPKIVDNVYESLSQYQHYRWSWRFLLFASDYEVFPGVDGPLFEAAVLRRSTAQSRSHTERTHVSMPDLWFLAMLTGGP